MISSYHFIGLGGIGMSALARVLLQKNEKVRGTDLRMSALLQLLQQEGADIHIGHNSSLIKSEDIVIYSTDISPSNVELLEAKRQGLRVLHRSDCLDFLMQGKKPLLVTGTHGKTTTSALLAHVLQVAHLDPSFVVGGILISHRINGKAGTGSYFVAEADESDGSFLRTKAFGAIVTNLEPEHMSYWKTEEKLCEAFGLFFRQVKSLQHLFWCKDDSRLSFLCPQGFSYGFSRDSSCKIDRYIPTKEGLQMDLTFLGKKYQSIELSLSGRHHALNGSSVFALGLNLGISEESIRFAFKTFQGTARRLEKIGSSQGIDLFDDYGHHPTEIKATLLALKERSHGRRIVVLFQPHRFSRVQDLMKEFSLSFEEADLVVMTDIYSAGEAPIEGVTSENLYRELQKKFHRNLYFFERTSLKAKVPSLLCKGDVVISFGAGDITGFIRELLQCL